MKRMTVGGRKLELDREQVLRAMRRRVPEPIREHLVEIGDELFPPKQVLATITGWERTSFTTMEAQRVLTKVGFVCRRAHVAQSETATKVGEAAAPTEDLERRVESSEANLVVVHQAIARLSERLDSLEASRR